MRLPLRRSIQNLEFYYTSCHRGHTCLRAVAKGSGRRRPVGRDFHRFFVCISVKSVKGKFIARET